MGVLLVRDGLVTMSSTEGAGQFSELVLGQHDAGHGQDVVFGQSSGHADVYVIIVSDVHHHGCVGQANDSHAAPYGYWSEPA